MYLSHGDDPYTALSKATPPFPAVELLIDTHKYDSWFGPGLPHEQKKKNIGRRPKELALVYLSNHLLYLHCKDLSDGLSHQDSRVYALFEDHYSLMDLEAIDLWGRMDVKISGFGGCGQIPL
jgi:hypothetical protein